MKVVGSTCGGEVVRHLSQQSLSISKSKAPLRDEHMHVFLRDMNSCYSMLKDLVPTLHTNEKATRVEILQHVIDYIWDLQLELDSAQGSTRRPWGPDATRTPITTLNTDISGVSAENLCSDDRILCR